MNTFTTKHSILALMLLIFTQGVYAQTKEGSNWYFGIGAAMTWNQTQTIVDNGKTLTGMPTPLAGGSAMTNQEEGVFCMSDRNGNLLFYSDGMTIWNRNHQVMPNGAGMFGHNSSAQSGIVIPYPEQPDKYIAFSMSLNNNSLGAPSNRLAYSIVDMTEDGGFGAVVTSEKNILLTGAKGILGESVSAVRHSNNVDFWIVAVGKGNGENSALNVWKVTSSGVQTTCVGSYQLATNTSVNAGANGYLRFSNNGESFAWGEYDRRMLHFGKFNPSTGAFSNIKNIDFQSDMRSIYGVEFSPSNEILYASSAYPTPAIFAFKFTELLAAPNSASFTSLTYRMVNFVNRVFALQLGPDERIYGTTQNTSQMAVIDNPDDFDNATSHSINGLITGQGRLGLPNFLPDIFTPTPKHGVIGANQTICNNTAPAQLTSIADAECDTETITYLWQRSTDSLSWSNATGTNNLSTYQPPALTATTFYRRNATSASCGTVHSNVVKITVGLTFSAGTISNTSTSIASGATPNAFTSTPVQCKCV